MLPDIKSCSYRVIFNRKSKDLSEFETSLIQIEIYFPNKKRMYIGTGIYIRKDQWDEFRSQIINSEIATKQNKRLSDVVNQIRELELDLLSQGLTPSPESFKTALNNSGVSGSFFEYMTKSVEARTDIEGSTRRNHMASAMAMKESGIVLFKDLTLSGLEKCTDNLRKSGKAQPTIHKIHKHIKYYLAMAIKHGVFPANKDPYVNFKTSMGKSGIRPRLDDNEMSIVEAYLPTDKRMDLTRDLFVFSMYTGLAYKDLCSLQQNHIRFVNEEYWIEGLRKKGGEYYSLPVLDPALKIIEKYKGAGDFIFPAPHLTEQNRRLKTLSTLVGLKKELTTHIARHTCATFLLRKGVHLKTVSEILGHTKINTTEIYAKLEPERVKEEFDTLRTRLSSDAKKSESKDSKPLTGNLLF